MFAEELHQILNTLNQVIAEFYLADTIQKYGKVSLGLAILT
jgi:hypothetical protein